MAIELVLPPLADEVVALRPWTAADLPAVLTAFGDPAIHRFSWPHERPYTEADARSFLASQQHRRGGGDELDYALAAPSQQDTILGGGSVYGIDLDQGRATVGYWVAPGARGRGVATHAVRLVAGWAFEALGIARLELTCGPDNLASQRVALRCGFVQEGVMRSHLPFKGGRRDTVLFSLLPGELRD